MTWTPNVKIPSQLSRAAPAIVAFNRVLHMVHLGDTSNSIWHSTFDGSGWTTNVKIPNQSSWAAPSLAEFNGSLHMVHLGDSSTTIWHSIFDGFTWSANVKIPNQQSRGTPALAEFNGALHMVHLGETSNSIWHSTFDGSGWTANVKIPNQSSWAAPALAEFNGSLHMVHLGDSSTTIWHSTFDGSNWSANVKIPSQLSIASPSIAEFNGNLHIVHLGDSSNSIWHAQHNTLGVWTANVRIPNQLSQATAGLAPYDGQLHMVHLGDSAHDLWHSYSDGALPVVRIGAKVLLDANMTAIVPAATINLWLTNMQTVFATMGFTVQLVNTENLNLPALRVVDVGDCVMGSTTEDQQTLFENRNNLNATDIAVYFITATVPAANGCAAHPNNQPACVVAATASNWTMAHECGHVLGLPHCDSPEARLLDRLMTGGGTFNLTNLPPDFIYDEGVTIGESDFSIE